MTSATSDRCRIVTRSPRNPNDDIYLSKGQSWVSLTSGSAGQSFVTLAAPQLSSGRRAATAIIDWTDATWECPKPVLTSLEKGELITKVYRNTDHSPLPNWNVRYTYIDGPKVALNETGTTTANVSSDAKGRAILHLFPETTESGTTRIAIQIFDPDLPAQPVHQCIGYVTWSESEPAGGELTYPETPAFEPADQPATLGPPKYSSDEPAIEDAFEPGGGPRPFTPRPQVQREPKLEIDVENPPQQARIGDKVEYRINVANSGDGYAENVLVTTTDTARTSGMQFVGSVPQAATYDGGRIVWELGDVGPKEQRLILAEYGVLDIGDGRNRFETNADNAPAMQVANVTTTPTGDVLDLRVSPPEPFTPQVGQNVVFGVQVANRASQSLPVELIVQDWTRGIEPIVKPGSTAPSPNEGIKLVFDLPRGPSEWKEIPFRTLAPGTHSFKVIATVPGSSIQQVVKEGVINVRAPQPPVGGAANGAYGEAEPFYFEQMTAGSKQTVRVEIRNIGTGDLTDAVLIYKGDEDIAPSKASAGETSFSIPIGTLGPGRNTVQVIEIEASRTNAKRYGENQVIVESAQGDRIIGDPFRIEILRADEGRRGIRVQRAGLEVAEPRLSSSAAKANSLQATIETVPANVQAGEPFEYFVTVANENRQGYRDLSLCLNLPEGIEILSFRGPPMTKTHVSKDGRHLDFGTVREIMSSERLTYRAKAISKREGRLKTVARVEATGLINPVIVGTSVNIR